MHDGADNSVQQLKSLMSGYQNHLEVMTQKVIEQQKDLEEMDAAKNKLASSTRTHLM